MVDEVSPSSASSFEMLDMEAVPPPYQEVPPHWFYCRLAQDNTSWLPFSTEDSDKLEAAYCNGIYLLTLTFIYVHFHLVYLRTHKCKITKLYTCNQNCDYSQ